MPKVNVLVCLIRSVDEGKARSALKEHIPSLEFISQALELGNMLLHCSADKDELESIFAVKIVPVKMKSSNLNLGIIHTVWGHQRPFIIPSHLKDYVAYALVDHVLLTIE